MESKKDKLYEILSSGLFYTVDQLAEQTGLAHERVREYISRFKNVNTSSVALNLVQIQDEKGDKRWGILKEKVRLGE